MKIENTNNERGAQDMTEKEKKELEQTVNKMATGGLVIPPIKLG